MIKTHVFFLDVTGVPSAPDTGSSSKGMYNTTFPKGMRQRVLAILEDKKVITHVNLITETR